MLPTNNHRLGLTLIAVYRPLGPNLIHVCRQCFSALDPEAPRTCLPCRTITCVHVPCMCVPEAHERVPHLAVPIPDDLVPDLIVIIPPEDDPT